MSKYDLNFNIDKNGIAKISVSSVGIAFSKESIELLKNPPKVNIGINRKSGILGVRAAVPDANIRSYPFVTNEKRNAWLRINSKALINEIQIITKTTFTTKAIPFIARFDDEEQMLIVDLKQKWYKHGWKKKGDSCSPLIFGNSNA